MNEQEIRQFANGVAEQVCTGITYDENFNNVSCGQVRLLYDRICNTVGNMLTKFQAVPPLPPSGTGHEEPTKEAEE